ncbi:MAG: STAS domain-containing protein [Sediminibacterium sp.]
MLNVKIDTKEKFAVITLETADITANMSASLTDHCKSVLNSPQKNLILNLEHVETMDPIIVNALTESQQYFYENSASFVVFGIKEKLETSLDEMEVLEMWNITPTESEAWDIVQMEEIERELLDGDDINFENHPEEPV